MRSLIAMLLLLVPVCAQMPQEPKNLKLLKPEELRPAMGAFRTALGVQCNFCHVQGDFASDENPNKAVARNMIAMAKTINANFRGNRERVTCYTCHRGKTEPETAPPAAQ